MDIVEVDFERILKRHYFIVTLASSPSAQGHLKRHMASVHEGKK
jgi:hypothetical protein